jgi:FixJ family two-component response regulator
MFDSRPVVLVVDDDRAMTFASAREFLAAPRVTAPSCLVLDMKLPDLNGLELQARMTAARRIELPIIFITAYGSVPMAVRAMKAGAIEFLTKPFEDEALLRAIGHAIERSGAALRREAELQTLVHLHSSLSRREREVMSLVCTGLLNKQVAGTLGISEITVKAHRGKVMRKMNARSLADLVKIEARLGLAGSGTVIDRSAAAMRVAAAPFRIPACVERPA